MSESEDKSIDLLGIKPVATSIEKSVNGAGAFLSRICLPAAEELGHLFKDRVSSWRQRQAVSLAIKAEQKLALYQPNKDVKVSPRIAFQILDEGAWIEDEVVHDMWAGLLASSCESDGADDGNIVFISILKQLTASQVRILRDTINRSSKFVSAVGWPYSRKSTYSFESLCDIMEISDDIRIDRELDHLRSLELFTSGVLGGGSGFGISSREANLTASPLALNLYVKAEGFSGSPVDFWNLELEPKAANDTTKS